MIENILQQFSKLVYFFGGGPKMGLKFILPSGIWYFNFERTELNQNHLFGVQGANLDHFAHSITEISISPKGTLGGPQGVKPGWILFMNFVLES